MTKRERSLKTSIGIKRITLLEKVETLPTII
jgi:hypothetical protein